MTALLVPPAAAFSADTVDTICAGALPPPVVPVPQPTSGLAAGGVMQFELEPPVPVPLVPPLPVAPLTPPAPLLPAALPPLPCPLPVSELAHAPISKQARAQ